MSSNLNEPDSEIAPATSTTPPSSDEAKPPAIADLYATILPDHDRHDWAAAPAALYEDSSRYHVLRSHARGGLGEVFVAYDRELMREVALKEIQERHADHPVSRARFLLEAEVTGVLEHPGIVPVYSLGRYPDGRPYYVMKFVRGESLRASIDRFHATGVGDRDPGEREFELRRLLGRLVDVCEAIGYAHGRGVLHRDIKPDNIMLGSFGESLVVDWGLAKRIGQPDQARGDSTGEPPAPGAPGLTIVGSSVGTPQFMSPEQVEGHLEQLGPASDIYSLGATLYYLLTGSVPFGGDDLTSVLMRVARGEFPPPRALVRSIPRGLEAICLKAMALRPECRYPTAGAMANDIERWMADESIIALPDRIPNRIARWLRHRPALLPWLAIFALIDISLLLESSGVRAFIGSRVEVLKMSVAGLAATTALFVQLHVIIGACAGAFGDRHPGGLSRRMERGAVRGFKIGLLLTLAAAVIISLAILFIVGFGPSRR